MEKQLVTVVTVCLNSEKYIEDAIISVLNQTYNNFEYIIIDGESTDKTLNIIQKLEPLFNGRMTWISEKDDGIYDAMNKGIKMANGDLIGILNSDDWYSKDAVETIISNYKSDVDIYYGNLYIVKSIDGDYYKKKAKASDISLITKTMSIAHPTCFVHRKWYEHLLFDSRFKIAADYKFMVESYRNGAIFKRIDKTYVFMRTGGISCGNYRSVIETFLLEKELFGRCNIPVMFLRLASMLYHKIRKQLALMLLPGSLIKYYETFNWEKF